MTSRAALRLRGEYEFIVPPLALPDPRRMPALDDLAEIGAVHLFLQCARAVRSEVMLSATTAPAIVDICRRLDGLPLAIELAAAQVRVLPVPALLTRLSRRLPLLSTGPVDLPERQRTMCDTIAWSYDLLSSREQALFRVLSICVGGATLATAEVLWSATGEIFQQSLEADVSAGLAALVQQSLLSMLEQRDGSPRFVMLETVREYGLEQLASHGETDLAEHVRAQRFVSLAEEAEPGLQGATSQHWLEQLEVEHNNIRAALTWARQQSQQWSGRVTTSADGTTSTVEAAPVEIGLRISTALRLFWEIRGHLAEGCSWLEAFLDSADRTLQPRESAMLRGKASNVAGWLTYKRADYGRAIALCERSLELYALAGKPVLRVRVLNNLAGIILDAGDPVRARAIYEECLAVYRVQEDRWGAAGTLNNLGTLALDQGDYQDAERWLEQGLALSRASGDPRVVSITLVNVAEVARHNGSYDRADAALDESLKLAVDLRDREQAAFVCEGMARVAQTRAHMWRAAYLCALAASLRDGIDAPLPPIDRAAFDRTVSSARAALTEEEFLEAWTAGRGQTLESATGWMAASYVRDGTPAGRPDPPNGAGV